MSCRDSDLSSVMITFARGASGITDAQGTALNHDLMTEARHANVAPPTREQWENFIAVIETNYRSRTMLPVNGARQVAERLTTARTEPIDAVRFYAAQRIVERARRAETAQAEYLEDYARFFGVPVTFAETEFEQAFQDAVDNSRLRCSPAFEEAWRQNPDHTNMFPGRRALYAYEQMEISRAARELRLEARPGIPRLQIPNSFLQEVGYDPEAGRCEVIMRDRPDVVYSYRLSRDEYQAFIGADHPGEYFSRNIRGNPDYQYGTPEDATAVCRNCANCGQFMDRSHSCPPMGSEEALNRDVRLAVERARINAAGGDPASLRPITRLAARRTVRYPAEFSGRAIDIRMPGVTNVTQTARRDNQVLIPIQATEWDDSAANVSGLVQVNYNGYGLGYDVEPVTTPGDTGRDQLRCRCERYRANYDCEHVRATVGRVRDILNGANRATPEEAQAVVAEVLADLETEYDASVAATTASTARFTPLSTNFTDNPEAFQELYTEARASRAAYLESLANGTSVEYPVPFYRENALGGLGTRESGRGFGPEIEFSFPGTMTWQERQAAIEAIGRELHAAGLTRYREQRVYGDSHGWVRDNQHRGWAFEEDPSTGTYGGDILAGGEIIAPISYDEPEFWNNIEKVCDIVTRHGGIASVNSGMHVHVSTGDYDHRVENHNRLMQSFAEHSDLIYRMSTNPERGKHRRGIYNRPNSFPSSPYTTVQEASLHQSGHGLALNLQSVSGDTSDHVEYRTADSSLNPGVIQAQIAMAVYMAEGATRPGPTTPNEAEEPKGAHIAANPDRANLTGDAWNQSTRTMRRFLDKFVPGNGGDDRENRQVRQLVALFAMTRWQRS